MLPYGPADPLGLYHDLWGANTQTQAVSWHFVAR